MRMLAFAFFLLVIYAKAQVTDDWTARAIKAVANWYGLTCIVLFRPDDLPLRESELIFHELKVIFDGMGMADVQDFGEGVINYRFNNEKCVNILHVIDARHDGVRLKLEKMSHSLSMRGPIWLVFLPDDTRAEDYLQNTNVPFNADFIAVETWGPKSVLKQAYRVSMRHSVRTTAFGTWSEEKGLIIEKYVPHWKRDNLEGKTFRISAIENWPLTILLNNSVGGYFGSVWKDLEQRMNFSTIFIKPKESKTGTWDGTGWTGLMGMIARGEIDAAISSITMTPGRLRTVDFLRPLYATRYQIFFKPPGSLIRWDLILRPFKAEVWLTLLLWIALTTGLLLMAYRIGIAYGLEDPKFKNEFNCIFLLASVFCQQAVNVTPKSNSCRIVLATAYLFSSIIVIIFSCTLTSMIAIQEPVRPFDSLESFLADGTYTLHQIPGSDSYNYFAVNISTMENESPNEVIKDSTDPVRQEIYKKLFAKIPEGEMPITRKSALKRVCVMDKVAHFGEFGLVLLSAQELSQNEGCRLIYLERPLKLLYQTIATSKGSPYRESLNYQLSRMIVTGIISRVRSRTFPLWVNWRKSDVNTARSEHIIQVNLILYAGVAGGVIALLMEIMKVKSYPTSVADKKTKM